MTELRESDKRLARHRIEGVVRSVRWRWRARQLLRGLLWVTGLTAVVLFLSALGLERARFASEWVVAFRFLTWGTLAVSTYLFLIRPLLRRVSDNQVALYLEEHEPSLEHSVVSALDESDGFASPDLRHRVVEVALDRTKRVEYGRRVEQSNLYKFAGALTVLVLLALGTSLYGPAHLRHGLAALLQPTVAPDAVNPYSIAVTPGDVTIPRNSDQTVTATLSGFEASDVSIFTKTESEQTFRRLSMLPALEGESGFEVMLVGVSERTDYFVSSTGLRTPTFTIDVADLPYVDQLDLTYYYPSYTGLPARVIEDGGDVAALPGTVVEVRIRPTMDAPAGQLLLDAAPAGELTRQDDGTFVTRFTVGDNLFYSIELARASGELVPASPEYTIDVLDDRAPSIEFSEPGRDETASPLEEFYLEMNATDDYGIRDVRLVFSVNAGPEDTIAVFETSGAPLSEVSAGHTLFLEEYELEPGDLVSYYAIARDNRTGGEATPVTSDIYFLSIRPFERAYRQAPGGGGGGGGGGQQQDTPLSDLQRQVIAATFNLMRQRDSYEPGEFSENVNSVALAQGRLIGQVGTLLQRMQNRGLTQSDPGFRDVSAVLPQAIEAMQAAADHLGDEELQEAMPDEQEALRRLQQAEETYERYVQQQQGGGGGGGGAQRQAAEDLADLFELELDQLQNQYETVQRGQSQQADNEVDELLEQLQELARRQQQEAERQRRRAQQSAQGGGGGGQSQRDLAEETEEAARQLQRLARQTNDRELEETARSLMDAARQMREAASQSGSSAATSDAQSALQRLEEARRELQDQRSQRAQRDTQEALDRISEMQAEQREIQREVRDLPTERGQERTDQIERLRERKDQMEQEVGQLERDLDNAASSARADNPDAARDMQAAANMIRETELRQKIRYSRNTIEQWDPETATTLELNIEADLQSLRDRLEEANATASDTEPDPLEEALDETRSLVRGMEAMNRRLNEPGQQQGQPGQQGQQGQQQGRQSGQQQGQQGQQGQQNGQQNGQQQGQQGQQGGQQQGQQGQQGGQQQGQQGQQGGGQQGGNPNGGGRNADGFGGGGNYNGDYRYGAGPRQLTDDEMRQYRSQMERRAEQIRDLRQDLRAMGRPVEELDRVLDSMTRLDDRGVLTDPRALAEIHQSMLDQLKRMEFGLRREVEGETGRNPTLTGSDEVPDGYRTLVEEYYRALARGESSGN